MAHKFMDDDVNIVKKCRDYGFCCTYDTENSPSYESVEDAIDAVLESRKKQSEKLGRIISRTDGIMGQLQKVIAEAEKLVQIPGNSIGLEADRQKVIDSYQKQLAEKRGCLDMNLRMLKEAKRVMDRKNIRVPVVGVINSGKSTFLHSALGGSVSDKEKENLFPSAGAHKSCTGTRTVLIYDNGSEGVSAVARFKDKVTFLNDCSQSVRRMINVLEKSDAAGRYTNIHHLQKALAGGSDPIVLLREYYKSDEFHGLCEIHYSERDAESVHDFCSFVHFAMNQDYSEDKMDVGRPKNTFSIGGLIKSWNEGTSYSVQIPSGNDFESVKNFVCKYDPSMEKAASRYTTYCGVQVVEIRGNLCREIAGLELIDSVGANDDAISNEDQMKALMQDSDAIILLERPQPQVHGGWAIGDCIEFVREQGKAPDQVLYLAYNCYNNNITIPSDLSHDLDNANKYYSEDCKRIYVTDVGEWEEVQSKMLVDMLVNLSNSVEETHREYLNLAKKADTDISGSIASIGGIAENLGQICTEEDRNASEKRSRIENIFQQLFGAVEKMIFSIGDDDQTDLRARAKEITENLTGNLGIDSRSADFSAAYEYVSYKGPRCFHNRYVAFLCLYSHMLEDVKRQYDVLKTDINTYVGDKRKELLKILWEDGRFKYIMSGLAAEGGSTLPDVKEMCGWLKKDGRGFLADVLENLLLRDIEAEKLIDGSIGKVIEQFDPKNLAVGQLFGPQMSDPALENNENSKAAAIAAQLSVKAEELKNALLESISGNSENSFDMAEAGQGDMGEKEYDNSWDIIYRSSSRQNHEKTPASQPARNVPAKNSSLFDLDTKVRKGVVCDDILKKFRDKLRGEGLPQNAKQPIDQLYDLYYQYYDVLLSEEEVSHKKRFNELRHDVDGLAKRLAVLCQD